MFSKFTIITVLLSVSVTIVAVRADYDPQAISSLKSAITQELTQNYHQFNNPRIELGVIRLLSGKFPQRIKSVILESENSRGQAQFAVCGQDDDVAEVLADYAAWVDIRVANRRITPGEHLSSDLFTTERINVASGMPYEQRGILLSATEDLSNLETRQSILVGQSLVATAVQKVPDVRRGDNVRIRVISGDLNLSTQGTATEAGYTHSNVKVVTNTNHRELTGVLQPGGVVEVKL